MRLGPALRFKMESMSNAYEVWIGEVQRALRSINMSMDDWQGRGHSTFRLNTKRERRPTTRQ